MTRSQFLGTGMAVPANVVTNDDLSALMDTSDEWIRTRTGIQERRWAREGETGADLALAASHRALEMADLRPADVDAIVYATSTPDHFAPGNGVFLQRMLGAGPIPAIDIRTQCSGFVYALSVADAWIRTGMYRRVLVAGAEVQSYRAGCIHPRAEHGRHLCRRRGRRRARARRCEPARASSGSICIRMGRMPRSCGWTPRARCTIRACHMNSSMRDAIFWRWTARRCSGTPWSRMPESVSAVLAGIGATPADLSLLIPHQANLRISEMVQKTLGLRDDQVYNNIQRYGNTTAATIPIALDECVRASGRVTRGDLLAFTAFGSGFMWGSVAVRW